jgi:hypothetical protein
MYETPRAWPLQWPAGYPRTPVNQRRLVKFTNHRKPLTIAASIARLQHQVDLLGGNDTVLSNNVETRMDGLPRSDARMPEDPDVCVYFHLKGQPTAMPCDAYRAR